MLFLIDNFPRLVLDIPMMLLKSSVKQRYKMFCALFYIFCSLEIFCNSCVYSPNTDHGHLHLHFFLFPLFFLSVWLYSALRTFWKLNFTCASSVSSIMLQWEYKTMRNRLVKCHAMQTLLIWLSINGLSIKITSINYVPLWLKLTCISWLDVCSWPYFINHSMVS